MPKFKDSMSVVAFPDIYLVNPDGRVVACRGEIIEEVVKSKGGSRKQKVYLGHPAIEKADKGVGGWRFASKDEIGEQKAKDEAKAAKDREAMSEMQDSAKEAAVLVKAAKGLKKGKLKDA